MERKTGEMHSKTLSDVEFNEYHWPFILLLLRSSLSSLIHQNGREKRDDDSGFS